VEPELGRDATVAVVLIAAIVALATGTVALGLAVLAAAALVAGVTMLIRSLAGSPRDSRTAGPRGN
jgi:hypothetical protein